MIEYIYRGFKISYLVEAVHQEDDLFIAKGHVTCLLNLPKSKPVDFHTEYATRAGVEHEIRVMLENHINIELKNYQRNTPVRVESE